MEWNFFYQITATSRTPDLVATAPRSPFPLSSVLNWICWTPPPPRTKFLGTPLPGGHRGRGRPKSRRIDGWRKTQENWVVEISERVLRIQVAGDICLRRPRSTKGCTADYYYYYYYYYSCSAGRYWALTRDSSPPPPYQICPLSLFFICVLHQSMKSLGQSLRLKSNYSWLIH
jgi:hypothetical protein